MTQKEKTHGRAKKSGPSVPWPVRALFAMLDRVSPTLAGQLAGWLFLRTRRYRVPDRERQVLAGAERHELATERGPAVAWVWGRPAPPETRVPTVLLVHGWEGRGSQLGAFVDPLRSSGFRVVAVDAPGHGEAPGNSSSIAALAATVEAAVALWGPAVGVVAHSAGAAGTTYALARGLAVERAVFVAPGSELSTYTHAAARLLGIGDAALRELERSIVRRIGVRFEEIEPLRRAPEVSIPLLAIADRDDLETPLDAAERLVAVWPRATLQVTEGLGHRRILRDADVVNAAVRFFRETPERRPRPAEVPVAGIGEPELVAEVVR